MFTMGAGRAATALRPYTSADSDEEFKETMGTDDCFRES